MGRNYKKKLRKIQPTKKIYKTKSFIFFLSINSIPFAITTETGKSTYKSSEPFFTGNRIKKRITVSKLIINKYQLLLKVLLMAMVAMDLKITENKEKIKILIINQ